MRIGFILDDSGLSVDLCYPPKGNPGVGGTLYLFAGLAYELATRFSFECLIAHVSEDVKLPHYIKESFISSHGSFRHTLHDTCDLWIFRAGGSDMQRTLDHLPCSTPKIAWAHNHLRPREYELLAREPSVRAIVHVGAEQHALAGMSVGLSKAVCIPNALYMPSSIEKSPATARAVYLGALVPSKGFGRLARVWPDIVTQMPGAQLDVIGSADLYSGTRLASGKVMFPNFEARVKKRLAALYSDGSIRFHGRIIDPMRKAELLSSCRVGLPNPTGWTETFCLSAVEMSMHGVWVVAPRRWGFMDTVKDGVTGDLTEGDKHYIEAVIRALQVDRLESTESRHAVFCWLQQEFSYTTIAPKWQALFEEVLAGPIKARPREIPRGTYPLPWRFAMQELGGTTHRVLHRIEQIHGWYLRNR